MTIATCSHKLSLVDVLATYAPSISSSPPLWNPISFSPSSLTHHSLYDARTQPAWFGPCSHRNPLDYISLSPFQPAPYNRAVSRLPDLLDELASDTLFPKFGDATNFLENLGVYAEYVLHNASAYRNTSAFVDACQAMYTAYTAQFLTELRPYALAAALRDSNGSTDSIYKKADAVFTYRQERIMQNPASTYALMALLSTMLLCLLWVFIRFPSKAILPKCPGSIAARLSFVAGSRLVARLRSEGVVRTGDTDVWEEKASLGWWWREDGEEEGRRGQWRWGIDIGEGCVARNWDDEPSEPPARRTEEVVEEDGVEAAPAQERLLAAPNGQGNERGCAGG